MDEHVKNLISALNQTVKRLTKENKLLEKELLNSHKRKRLILKNRELEKTLFQLEDQKSSFDIVNKNNETLKNKLLQASKIEEQLGKELSDAKQKLKSAVEKAIKFKSLSDSFKISEKDLKEKSEEIKILNINFETKLNKLLLENKFLRSENEQYSSKINNKKTNVDELEKSLSKLNNKHKSLTEDIQSSEKSILQAKITADSIIYQAVDLAQKFKNDISELLTEMRIKKDNPKKILDSIEGFIADNKKIYDLNSNEQHELSLRLRDNLSGLID